MENGENNTRQDPLALFPAQAWMDALQQAGRDDGGSPLASSSRNESHATQADVPTLLTELRVASGENRRRLLDVLDRRLRDDDKLEDILAALGHASNDVRRVALDNLLKKLEVHSNESTAWSSSNDLAQAVLQAGRRSLLANASTSLTACQAGALALRASRTTIEKAPAIPQATYVNAVLDLALASIGIGLAVRKPQSDARTVRKLPGAALSFGRGPSNAALGGAVAPRSGITSSKAATEPFGSNSLQRQSSSSSLRSLGALSIASSSAANSDYESSIASASESDVQARQDGEQAQKRLAAAQRNLRKETITLVASLNKCCAGLLLARWPDVLCEGSTAAKGCLLDVIEVDPFASNRVLACRAIEAIISSGARSGFLTGVEERRRATFTSLSNRIASAIVDTRAKLNTLLLVQSPNSVTEAILRCAKVFVDSTRNVKLLKAHADVLRPAALQLCSRQNPALAIAAFALLSALPGSSELSTLPDLDHVILPTLRSADEDARVSAWQALAQAITNSTVLKEADVARLIELAERQLPEASDVALRDAIASFVLGACRQGRDSSGLTDVLDRICNDSASTVRSVAAECMAFKSIARQQRIHLLEDRESAVRATAVRSIGVRALDTLEKDDVEDVLKSLADSTPLVRTRASWSLGNLCETAAKDSRDEWPALLKACLALREENDRIAVHAIRGAGALFAACSPERLDEFRADLAEFLMWNHKIMTDVRDPKSRWNALAALTRVLKGSWGEDAAEGFPHLGSRSIRCAIILSAMRDACREPPLEVISRVVATDNIFKTRLAGCNVLLAACEAGQIIVQDYASSETVCKNLDVALESVTVQLSTATFREAQMHVTPLKQGLERLQILLKS